MEINKPKTPSAKLPPPIFYDKAPDHPVPNEEV